MKSGLVLVLFALLPAAAVATCIQAGQEQAEATKIIALRKQAGVPTEPFMMRTYPPIVFQGANLPTVWLGPEFIELVGEAKTDGKSVFQTMCLKENNDRHCLQWCTIRSASPQFYSADSQEKILSLCEECDSHSSDKCAEVQFLKNSSDALTLSTFEKKPAVLQMSTTGELLVFQTGSEGKKDLAKPYLKITQKANETQTFQKVEVVGGTEGSANVQSFFKKNPKYGFYGFRVCDQAVMSVDSCKSEIHSTGETGISFACQPRGATIPADTSDVKVKR
jgi:hypothetical protein